MENSVLSWLQPEAQKFIRDNAAVRSLASGELIYEDKAVVTHTIFPHDCVVSVMAEMADGRSVEKASIGREGFVGLPVILGGGKTFGRCVAQVPGKASWLSVADLDVALQRFACVRQVMLRYAKSFTMQLMESVACNSLHTAEQRVVRWLLHAHDRVDGNSFYLTQEAISNLLALRRATVNGVCSELQSTGGISYHRGNLTIADRDVLLSRVCECYDRVRRAAIELAP
mgnify:FL=1